MTPFQIITIVFAFVGMLGGLFTVYTKMQMNIAKINAEMLELRNLINTNSTNMESIRKENREDHQMLFKEMQKITAKL